MIHHTDACSRVPAPVPESIHIHNKERPRVLLIAEACNPEWASVPLVAFNLYNALRQVADITLVTQVRNRDALKRRMGCDGPIVFIDSERFARPCHQLGNLLTLRRGLGWTIRQAVNWLPYMYFEHLVFDRFRAQLKQGEYDLIHRITPLSPTYPSPIASWTTVPLVLGPLNGGLPWPKGTTRTRLAEMEWLSYVRDVYKVMPYLRNTYSKAACVIAGSQYTLSALPRHTRSRAVYIPENGIDPERFNSNGRLPPSRIEPFRILFVGRLVPYKGADMLLNAVASSAVLRRHAEVVIVGDGPQRKELGTLTGRLGLTSHVHFTSALPQDEVIRHYRLASVFAFPSLREFGGAVIIEAMACGLPPVVVDYGGPGEYVTPEAGRTIVLAQRRDMIAQLQAHLEDLYHNRSVLDLLSEGATRRVTQRYTWTAKASQIAEVYKRVSASR